MKKSYEEQCKDVWAKEAKKAESLGFESVAKYRQYLADENKKRTYLAKVARYKKAIAEMEEWLAVHQPFFYWRAGHNRVGAFSRKALQL